MHKRAFTSRIRAKTFRIVQTMGVGRILEIYNGKRERRKLFNASLVKIMTLTSTKLNCVCTESRFFRITRDTFLFTRAYQYGKYFVYQRSILSSWIKTAGYSIRAPLPVGYFQDSSTIRHIYRKYFPAAMWSDSRLPCIVILELQIRVDRLSRINSAILARALVRALVHSHPEHVSKQIIQADISQRLKILESNRSKNFDNIKNLLPLPFHNY